LYRKKRQKTLKNAFLLKNDTIKNPEKGQKTASKPKSPILLILGPIFIDFIAFLAKKNTLFYRKSIKSAIFHEKKCKKVRFSEVRERSLREGP
jgi:hypothetical protein